MYSVYIMVISQGVPSLEGVKQGRGGENEQYSRKMGQYLKKVVAPYVQS